MNWLYDNKEMGEISDFPESTYGFIYLIEHIPSGKKYIGKKQLLFKRNVKLGKKELAEITGKGRKPKTKEVIKESDWKTYWGSSIDFNKFVKKEGEDKFKKIILHLCTSKKLLTYYEMKYLFLNEVIERENEYFNDNIQSHFYRKDFE